MTSSTRLSMLENHMSKATRSLSSSSVHRSASVSSKSVKRSGGGDNGDEPKVLTFHEGNTTTILLNRPKALNALDTEMIHLIDEAISSTPPHTHIVLRGKGRALCSGGDVMAVVTAANSTDPQVRQQALDFFKNEFELDYRIATLGNGPHSRAYVSIMDGITMGGGVGLSLHAPIRIATEKTLFAMPETGIGYFPDVGVTRQLSRLDGKVGHYLGLTGARISGEEAYLCGLATHFIPSASIESALHRLTSLPPNAKSEQVSDALDDFSVNPFERSSNARGPEILERTPFLGPRRIAMDYAFGRPTAESVYATLQDLKNGDAKSPAGRALEQLGVNANDKIIPRWAEDTIKTLDTKSPRSLHVSLVAINDARNFSEADSFRFDMRLATAFCDLSIGRDFFEGVTFTLTKDPQTGKRREGIADWSPKSIEDVDIRKTETLFFGPLDEAKQIGMQMEVPTLNRVPPGKQNKEDREKQAKTLAGIGPLRWEPSHNQYALPTEAECEAMREGSHPAAGDYELNQEEIIKLLQAVKSQKPGLDVKVQDWLLRRSLAAKNVA